VSATLAPARRLPLIAPLLLVAMIVVQASGLDAALPLDDPGLLSGLLCHLGHGSASQLLWAGCATVALALALEARVGRGPLLLLVGGSALAVSGAVVLLERTFVATYVGSSGVGHALAMGWALCVLRPPWGWAVASLLSLKVVAELHTGTLLIPDAGLAEAGLVPVPTAHAAGVLMGAVWAVARCLALRRTASGVGLPDLVQGAADPAPNSLGFHSHAVGPARCKDFGSGHHGIAGAEAVILDERPGGAHVRSRTAPRRALAAVVAVVSSAAPLAVASPGPCGEAAVGQGGIAVPDRSEGCMRVLTLNLAHGRGTAFHQAFTGRQRILQNLDAVAELICSTDSDVVALQELDAPSSWSGGFDHLDYLAKKTGYAHTFHGIHADVQRPRLAYGTGVLSRFPIRAGRSWKFAKNALDTKGYVITHIESPLMSLDLVSVHLDFKRDSERRAQLDDITQHLLERDLAADHLVVAGDFNCTVNGRGNVLSDFARRHALHAPDESHDTFPSRKPRRALDHVLVSSGLEVRRRMAVPVLVSDHLPVMAELAPRAKVPAAQ
jgi:endonuclease/exonuclease/phosphatase family metal-dependent hydrolase